MMFLTLLKLNIKQILKKAIDSLIDGLQLTNSIGQHKSAVVINAINIIDKLYQFAGTTLKLFTIVSMML